MPGGYQDFNLQERGSGGQNSDAITAKLAGASSMDNRDRYGGEASNEDAILGAKSMQILPKVAAGSMQQKLPQSADAEDDLGVINWQNGNAALHAPTGHED